MKQFLRHTILFFLALTAMTACQDDSFRVEAPFGEGMATITATVGFKPMAPALTRSDGKALSEISSLYVLFYDYDSKKLIKNIAIPKENFTIYKDSVREEDEKIAESQTKYAQFGLWDKIPYGKYRAYVVANIENLFYDNRYTAYIQTADSLKNILLGWDEKNIANNGEMIGHLTLASNPSAGEEEALDVNRENVNLHAWLRRAASKVTVAYDGSQLKEGVTIYILAVSIKDIPRTCLLGNNNKPAKTEELIHDGETIKYFEGSFSDLATFKSTYPYKVDSTEESWHGSNHLETDEALYFYENMQGAGENMPDKTQKDTDSDGTLDYAKKDNVLCGTYIEVDAIYTSKKETGTIKYRFMLGKNITTDYNAERNYHYKLTLKFKGTANNPDWHIDFQEQVFEVSDPKPMDYRGKVFVPEYRPWTENYNLGHTFDDNIVTVTSYIEEEGQLVPWEMKFYGDDVDTDSVCPYWLDCDTIDGYLPYVKNIRFRVKTLNVSEVDIDDLLQNATEKGSEAAPYNLANPGQQVSPENATIQNTANCYIVDAPGWYLLPLVYGNAIKDGNENKDAYSNASGQLQTFKDYLGKDITSPYIQNLNDGNYTPKCAFLLWQDEPDLITYNVWNYPTYPDIKYLSEAYNGKGGILFHIEQSNIKQGNAVIALSNDDITGDKLSKKERPPVMWSWHIWVTNFSFLKEADETIEVTNHDSRKYSLMPFNLGWTSEQDEKVKYYEARECYVKFSVPGTNEQKIIKLEQKSHIATTRGTSPYYQWGRKDPFVGARDDTKNAEYTNKLRYYSTINAAGEYWTDSANPERLSPDYVKDRCTTKEALEKGWLIQYPHLWHNPTRKERDLSWTWDTYDYVSENEVYTNLWRQPDGVKTVYDPCPVGYQIPSVETFSGFTTTGTNTSTDFEWYDVLYKNIAGYVDETERCGVYSKGVYEFYTNPGKLQSIVIPMSGYRDWDDDACAYKVNNGGKPIGYLWTSTYKGNDILENHKYILNLEFSRDDGTGYIRPRNKFYSCDGFPVRPVKTGN